VQVDCRFLLQCRKPLNLKKKPSFCCTLFSGGKTAHEDQAFFPRFSAQASFPRFPQDLCCITLRFRTSPYLAPFFINIRTYPLVSRVLPLSKLQVCKGISSVIYLCRSLHNTVMLSSPYSPHPCIYYFSFLVGDRGGGGKTCRY
jgi:hypothetical protein